MLQLNHILLYLITTTLVQDCILLASYILLHKLYSIYRYLEYILFHR